MREPICGGWVGKLLFSLYGCFSSKCILTTINPWSPHSKLSNASRVDWLMRRSHWQNKNGSNSYKRSFYRRRTTILVNKWVLAALSAHIFRLNNTYNVALCASSRSSFSQPSLHNCLLVRFTIYL